MLKYIKNNNFLIYAVALLPIYSIQMVSVSIFVLLLGSLIGFRPQVLKRSSIYNNLKIIVVFSLPFILHLISLLWTQNVGDGLKALEKNLAFLIFPIVIFALKPFKNKIQFEILKRVYVIATFALTLLTLIYISFQTTEILNQKSAYYSNIFLRQCIDSVPIIGEHPIYFSLIIAVALLFLFYNRFSSNLINISFYLVFSLGIILASSRGVILALIVVSLSLIFQSKKKRLHKLFVTLSLIMGIVVIGFSPPVKTRINEMIYSKNIYPEGVHFNSFNTRMAIYNCSFTLLKEVPLLGYAPADIQNELDECYLKFDTSAFDKQKYNTHNQYLDYVLSFGILGCLFLFLVLPYYIKISLHNTENKMYFNFLMLFLLLL